MNLELITKEDTLFKGAEKYLKEILDERINFTQNISKQWSLGDYEYKTKLQDLIFPDGLVVDGEKENI